MAEAERDLKIHLTLTEREAIGLYNILGQSVMQNNLIHRVRNELSKALENDETK